MCISDSLTTGIDPLSDELDGALTVEFGFPWSTDASGPSPREIDLYSTLLHEVTHALGILSVVDSDGASALGNQGGFGLFTIFDSMLVRGSTGQPLYLEAGEINASAEDVTSEDVLFAGDRAAAAFGSYPPVFAPNPFLEGSSIGHWSFTTGAEVVMLAAVDRGEQRRTFAAWELQALADLGYDLVEEGFPTDAGVPDPPIDPPPVPDPPIEPPPDPDLPIDPPGPPADFAPDDAPSVTGLDREPVASPSSQSPGGCSVSGTHTGAIWPIIFALLVAKRRRTNGREKPRG